MMDAPRCVRKEGKVVVDCDVLLIPTVRDEDLLLQRCRLCQQHLYFRDVANALKTTIPNPNKNGILNPISSEYFNKSGLLMGLPGLGGSVPSLKGTFPFHFVSVDVFQVDVNM